MIAKLKKQRRGYVVILIMVISLVTKLSPGMAMPNTMPMATSKAATTPADVMSNEANSEYNSSEASRANKKMHAGASGCHSAIYASTSEVITPSSAQSTAKNAHAIHSGSSAPREAMKSSMHGDTSESCCDVQCQCPTGVCATVYAVINNELSVAVIAPTPLVVFVNHQTPYTIPNTQFRPPKFTFAG
ncbi:hypothetical protein C7Y69_18795 [Alteromonas sp. KS69]|jgi:hypothetical protein|nr:hypothetical protein [Alteromonas naphthalenivorans]MBB67709.1 hypothetical protein [Rickettsiales bacterium]RUP75829.1 hypothetical protein C7Y69_18795 [Alteromonas sp. KS69]|tara:strand:- start:1433 stop:1996 length:564 start_codon:yes stop_codon:yes gene_type:complete